MASIYNLSIIKKAGNLIAKQKEDYICHAFDSSVRKGKILNPIFSKQQKQTIKLLHQIFKPYKMSSASAYFSTHKLEILKKQGFQDLAEQQIIFVKNQDRNHRLTALALLLCLAKDYNKANQKCTLRVRQ